MEHPAVPKFRDFLTNQTLLFHVQHSPGAWPWCAPPRSTPAPGESPGSAARWQGPSRAPGLCLASVWKDKEGLTKKENT